MRRVYSEMELKIHSFKFEDIKDLKKSRLFGKSVICHASKYTETHN